MTAWTIFHNPMTLSWGAMLWLVIPLCASVSLAYKTIRTRDLSRLPYEAIFLLVYILGGLAALGAGLWLIMRYWPGE
jgi:hypothetical protein